jgi:hypothetical protein
MYKCSKCNLPVIVLLGESPVRLCKCKIESRKRTRFEKIKMFFKFKVADILVDAPILASLQAEVFNISKMNG